MFNELFTQSMEGGHRLSMKQEIKHNAHVSKNLKCGNFLDFLQILHGGKIKFSFECDALPNSLIDLIANPNVKIAKG
jgi:hypothetical protein